MAPSEAALSTYETLDELTKPYAPENCSDGASELAGMDRLQKENDALGKENEALRQRVAELYNYMRLAYRDPLTGLRNRRYFDKRIAEEINLMRRSESLVFSLLVIDINDFKSINDTYGHATGDETLKWVAAFIEGNLRGHDICCRIAGDEFIVILPHTDKASCLHLVTRLREKLELANRWLEIPIGMSIGTATFPECGSDVESLFAKADESMYADKSRQKEARGETVAPRMFSRTDRIQLVRPTNVYMELGSDQIHG